MADKKTKQRGLGRGLSALMADVSDAPTPDAAPRADMMVPVEKVYPNPDQPRRTFDKEKLAELADSISKKGVIQPLIVRLRGDKTNEYEIVAGERRWRAAQMAQLHEVPIIVRAFDDVEVLEIAIIENIQRADLNPVEEALGYQLLMDKFGHTQERLASELGKSRSHIANCTRLLQLPGEVLQYLREGGLSAGHARALITAPNPGALAKEVIRNDLSVRETEKLAKSAAKPPVKKGAPNAAAPAKDADTRALEGDLSAGLGMKVAIDHKPGQEAGAVTIKYSSLEDLDTLCRLLSSG